jgi:ATP-binding cassette subfamily B (MDR/TAP) protein 1
MIYLMYAYAFYISSLFVENEVHNDGRDRPYQGGDSIGVFFAVLIGLFSIAMIANQGKAMVEAQVCAQNIFDIVNRKPLIQIDDKDAEKHQLNGSVEFKGVNFYYPARPDSKVLDNFCAKFESGKTTALVGPSGSGKSSIVSLIERFYDPESGEVFVDGKPLKSLNVTHFRNQIGYVPQEPVLFNATIRENILMGKPDATDDEITEALKAANAWGFVNE